VKPEKLFTISKMTCMYQIILAIIHTFNAIWCSC